MPPITDPTTGSSFNVSFALSTGNSADAYLALRQDRVDLDSFKSMGIGGSKTYATAGNAKLISLIWDGSNFTSYDNGSQIDQDTSLTVSTDIIDGGYIFKDSTVSGSSSRSFIGWIGEVIIIDTHDNTLRTEIEEYLQNKWGF